jgi:hypothetical protein
MSDNNNNNNNNNNNKDNKDIDLWYNNPYVIFDDLPVFLPYNNLTPNEKKNAIVRLAIYTTVIIIISKQSKEWYMLPVIILLASLFIKEEKFNNNIAIDSTNIQTPPELICQKPTKDNPFMNYTVGDLINNSGREGACNYVNVKEEVNNSFNEAIDNDNIIKLIDTSKIWGNTTSNRNFYTMPNTKIVNDQTEFANWCFGESGTCKSKGLDCLKVRDPTYHRGRITKM